MGELELKEWQTEFGTVQIQSGSKRWLPTNGNAYEIGSLAQLGYVCETRGGDGKRRHEKMLATTPPSESTSWRPRHNPRGHRCSFSSTVPKPMVNFILQIHLNPFVLFATSNSRSELGEDSPAYF
jgi:hypothetical protein